MILSIIVALAENNVVGINNKLPWYLPADLKRLKLITMGHHLVMGRRTYESLGRPLPGRTSVIITHNKDYKAEGSIVVSSIKEALEVVKNDSEPFIFGGGEIFREALPMVKRIYMTKIHHDFNGDTFFSELNEKEWKEVSREDYQPDEKNKYSYSFITLERVN